MRFSLFLFLGLLAITPVSSQTARITELQALNTAGAKDEDGTAQGWIELWNPSTTARITLTNQILELNSDPATRWTFPTFDIPPGERVIIWASGKNRRVTTAPLHTSFTLPNGGTLKLLNSAGTAISQLDYVATSDGQSYGRDEWDSANNAVQKGMYVNPSPGERNNFNGAGVAGKVILPTSRAFDGTLQITMALEVPDETTQIRYTTNQTIPTPTSTLYTGPLNLTATTVLRARAFKAGLLPGETETSGFLMLRAATGANANHAHDFSSNLPLAVITNLGAGTPPTTGDQNAFLWLWEPAAPDNRARFTNPPTHSGRIVMDLRGSSTVNNPKFNLNIEFRKARDDDDADYALLGMPAHADWVFHAPYHFDRSLVHNPLSYALSNAMGRYAARSKMAEVFIDTDSGYLTTTSNYFGVYNVMEKMRRGGDRIDVRRLDNYDNDAVGQTGGYIYKIDRQDPGDSGFTAGGSIKAYYYPKEVEMLSVVRAPQTQYLTNYLNSTNTALNSATWNNPVTGYAAWLDVPACIDHHLLNVWMFNVDALRLSGYWHKDRGGKLAAGPVWDFDRALSSTDGRDANPTTWRSTVPDLGTDFFNYPWWNRLFLDPEFYQKYIDRWQDLRRGVFSPTAVNALLDQLNNEIGAEAVRRDVARWAQTKRAWTSPFTGTVYPAPSTDHWVGQLAEIQRIKDWLQQRANFFDSQWVGPVTASQAEGAITPGAQVSLTGPANSVIYYTLNGADPRPAGGAVPDAAAATLYAGPITLAATTRLRARAYRATHTAITGANNPPLVSRWGGQTNLLYTTDALAMPGNLAITEINFHPPSPRPPETAVNAFWGDNDFEFLELKNLTEGTLSLAGSEITGGVRFAFTGENAVSIPAGGFLIVAANPDAFRARYGNTMSVVGPFLGSLSNGGETLTLEAANNAIIQQISYSDGWAPTADGLGKTLVPYNLTLSTSDYVNSGNWRASAAELGSPGTNEPNLTPEITPEETELDLLFPGGAIEYTVMDDGLPVGATVSVGWSQLSGSGSTNFLPPNDAATVLQFTAPGTYMLRLGATDGALTGNKDLTCRVHDTYTNYRLSVPNLGSALEDNDGDGMSNFMEFHLRSNPLVPDSALQVSQQGNQLQVIYSTRMAPDGTQTAVETSSDLMIFQVPAPGSVLESTVTEDGFTRTTRLLLPLTGQGPKRFVRLRVTMAEAGL